MKKPAHPSLSAHLARRPRHSDRARLSKHGKDPGKHVIPSGKCPVGHQCQMGTGGWRRLDGPRGWLLSRWVLHGFVTNNFRIIRIKFLILFSSQEGKRRRGEERRGEMSRSVVDMQHAANVGWTGVMHHSALLSLISLSLSHRINRKGYKLLYKPLSIQCLCLTLHMLALTHL
jgi:hypothetical protein